ncbi:patatin-like phospholipase family protein [Candidatus Halobeggiatoa sp. HSG11]|nr:patatin-like phospholipase family protein [Candidatus Halobeggiatoa sp. HSG11]
MPNKLPEYTRVFSNIYLAELNYLIKRRNKMGIDSSDLNAEYQRIYKQLTPQRLNNKFYSAGFWDFLTNWRKKKSVSFSDIESCDDSLPEIEDFPDDQLITEPIATPTNNKSESFWSAIFACSKNNSDIPDSNITPNTDTGLIGLSLSGGGVRSATFSLGLLQSLAKHNVLKYCDYLSGISGGGYTASCLSSLLASDSTTSTDAENFPLSNRRGAKQQEQPEVNHLRMSKDYLGGNELGSTDSWHTIGTFISGLILRGLIIILLLAFFSEIIALVDFFLLDYLTIEFPNPKQLITPIISIYLASLVITRVYQLSPKIGIILDILFLSLLIALVLKGKIVGGTVVLIGILGVMLPLIFLRVMRMFHKERMIFYNTQLAYITFYGGISIFLFLLITYTSKFLCDTESLFFYTFTAFLIVAIGHFVIQPKNGFLQTSKIIIESIGLIVIFVLFAMLFYVTAQTFKAELATLWENILYSVTIVTLLIISLSIDINSNSFHNIYRTRLSRTYLFKLDKNGIIQPNQSLLLKDLHRYCNGPYQLIGSTLNIPGSNNPNLKGRGADFFIFSKYYCGSESTGYRRTNSYNQGTIELSKAMAISGAAASPEKGSRTNPISAFLMTLFNIRLNVWMRNPNCRHQWSISPLWPPYLLKELFRSSTEKDTFVNLSDGGHHENLGIYPLLKRHCKLIIAADASLDPYYQMFRIAVLQHKARIDLGINIQMNLEDLRPCPTTGYSKKYFVKGIINYPDGSEGTLFYITTTLLGNEPEDLLVYRRMHPTFPDETTADQFFNEYQFESYRKLGELAGDQLAADRTMKYKNITETACSEVATEIDNILNGNDCNNVDGNLFVEEQVPVKEC